MPNINLQLKGILYRKEDFENNKIKSAKQLLETNTNGDKSAVGNLNKAICYSY